MLIPWRLHVRIDSIRLVSRPASPRDAPVPFCLRPFFAGGGLFAQTYSIPINNASDGLNGTLSWTINQSGGACGFEGQSSYQQWNYSNFQYTPTNGSAQPLSGSAVSFNSPGGNCPPNGGITTTIGNIPTAVGIYAINFTSESGGNGSGTPFQTGATETLTPGFQVVSIIYDPPGNTSSNGYTDTTSNATTTTIGSTFENGNSITFTEGFKVFGSFGMSVSQTGGTTWTTENSQASTQTFTDATGFTNQAPGGTASNVIDHSRDLFVIWLNPQITVSGTLDTPEYYSVGTVPTTNGQTPEPDIVRVSAYVMEANAQGHTSVPAPWLDPQPANDGSGQTTPGLAILCKNLNMQEYEASACTLADQCGCTPADFAGILAQDPLLNYSNTQNPLDADGSGPSVCGALPHMQAGSDCRYVPVPDPNPNYNANQETQVLAGPDYAGANDSCVPFSQGENQGTTITNGTTNGQSTGLSVKATFGGSFGSFWSIKVADTMTWQEQQSVGTSNGTGVTQSVNLCSNTVACRETVSVYEDTIYHTFIFTGADNSCP